MEQNTESSLFTLQVDHQGTAFLGETARWAKFLGILGFISCALIVVFAVFVGSIMSYFSRLGGGVGYMPPGVGIFVSVLYILIAVLYFFPCLYLFNFASKMQVAIRSNDQQQLNDSFRNLKSCFRFIGILTIISLGFCVLGVVLGIIGAAFH
jgi:hypothetical protein